MDKNDLRPFFKIWNGSLESRSSQHHVFLDFGSTLNINEIMEGVFSYEIPKIT